MKELWLFTTRFPYGIREAFLENELPVLCQRFDRVLIFPEHRDGPPRGMPPNAEIRHLWKDPYGSVSFLRMLSSPMLVWKLLRSLLTDAPSVSVLLRQGPALRSRMAQLMFRAGCFSEQMVPLYDPAKVTVYSYWTHDWATVLGLVKEREPAFRFFSRAHGFDLFEAQNKDGWLPFRSFQLKHVDRVYCVSRSGLQHLQEKHPGQADRFELSMLGTRDHGAGPHDATGPLKVVSCSFLIPRKRVIRLVEALALVDHPVRWTHFGGGEEEAAIREAAGKLPDHVTVDLRGMTLNKDVIQWYRTEPVDVFVHLSHLEGGVAVAVQEATSFGIPVIAADSGGVQEIMGPRTGVLLGNDPSPREVADLLNDFRQGPMSTATFRAGVRNEWRSSFEANATFGRFVDRILQPS